MQVNGKDTADEEAQVPAIDKKDVIPTLRQQIEMVFQHDPFVISQMGSDGTVPLSVIQQNNQVKAITTDTALIVEAVRGSKICSMGPGAKTIKSNVGPKKRTRIFLTDVADEVTKSDLADFFARWGKVGKVSREFQQNFVVEMDTEESARDACFSLTQQVQKLKGKKVRARLKAEPRLRSYPNPPLAGPAPGQNPGVPNPVMGFVHPMAGPRGVPPFYPPYFTPNGGMGFYPPFMPVPFDDGGNFRGRGGQFKGGRGRSRQGNTRFGRGVKNSGRGGQNKARSTRRAGARGDAPGKSGENRGRNRRGEGSPRNTRDGKGRSRKSEANTRRGRAQRKPPAPVPEFDSANFPSLGSNESQKKIDGTGGESTPDATPDVTPTESTLPPKPTVTYTANQLERIVKAIPNARIIKPDALKEVDAPGFILDSPLDELILRQRTVSMEMVDKDVRHGKPIRVDRAESADYDSMMYGEGRRRRKGGKDESSVVADAAAAVAALALAKKSKAKPNTDKKIGEVASQKKSWAALAASPGKAAAKPPVHKKVNSKKAAGTKNKPKDPSKSKNQQKKKANKSKSNRSGNDTKSLPSQKSTPTVAEQLRAATGVDPSQEPRKKRGWEKAETTAATKARLAELAAMPKEEPKTSDGKDGSDKKSESKKSSDGKKKSWRDDRHTAPSRRRPNSKNSRERDSKDNREGKGKLKSGKLSKRSTPNAAPRLPPAKWGSKKSFASILKDKATLKAKSETPVIKPKD